MDVHAIDAQLDARPEDAELTPSISADELRRVVAQIKTGVLAKLETKLANKAAAKMASGSLGIFLFSLLGLGLLLIPLIVKSRYPGRERVLFKYSAIAAATFFVTANLFGGVLFGMKGALGSATNPSIAIANATFDTLHDNAADYSTLGRELVVPTLMQIDGNSDEQPAALLIENGTKIVNDAKIFTSVSRMVKKLDGAFAALPLVLFLVTMVLCVLAIRPTLTELVKLPMRAAAGQAAQKHAMTRVRGEVLATLCTIGVLTALTFASTFILGRIVQPALDVLLGYFSLAVSYLQFVEGASSGVVFLTLFSVVLFLSLNLATLVLSVTLFLGKCQKIFQARWTRDMPVAEHKRFFVWGVPAVLFVQLFPLAFVVVAEKALDTINGSLLANIQDADQVPWTKVMLAGPILLVVAYALIFWGARGFKAIAFLFTYKVTPTAAIPTHPAEPI